MVVRPRFSKHWQLSKVVRDKRISETADDPLRTKQLRKMKNKKRILFVLHMPWCRNLGGPRAQFELAEELEKEGYAIDWFDTERAKKLAGSFVDLTSFQYQASKFIRNNCDRFDVVDAHHGNLPYAKSRLGFRGLLVARSVGLFSFYDEFEKKYIKRRLVSRLKDLVRLQTIRISKSSFKRSIFHADLVNVCNADEQEFVARKFKESASVLSIPFGITQDQRLRFERFRKNASERFESKTVTFIGAWSVRKGARDWPLIVNELVRETPSIKIQLLGVHEDPRKILSAFDTHVHSNLEIHSTFKPEDLPAIISRSTLGLFPSYVEGFPFAVLEKLASGMPVIAYDIPGCREMIANGVNGYLVAKEDYKKLSQVTSSVISGDRDHYEYLANNALSQSYRYSWSRIATATMTAYDKAIEEIQKRH